MNQPMFSCPFCDAPAWRTRYMLWMHMHECINKGHTGDRQEESAVVNIAGSQ